MHVTVQVWAQSRVPTSLPASLTLSSLCSYKWQEQANTSSFEGAHTLDKIGVLAHVGVNILCIHCFCCMSPCSPGMSAKLRMIVQHGLNTLRAREKHGLQPALAIYWAQCLCQTVHTHAHVSTSSARSKLDKRKEVFFNCGVETSSRIAWLADGVAGDFFLLYFYSIPKFTQNCPC